MDVYFISILIIGAVIFIKVLIIVCIYVCRARNPRRNAATNNANREDAAAFPQEPHNMRSAIVNFEEVPQPIICVPPGSDPALSNPMLAPPPYNTVAPGGKNEKPPNYEEIMNDVPPPGIHYGVPAFPAQPSASGQSTVATGSTSDA